MVIVLVLNVIVRSRYVRLNRCVIVVLLVMLVLVRILGLMRILKMLLFRIRRCRVKMLWASLILLKVVSCCLLIRLLLRLRCRNLVYCKIGYLKMLKLSGVMKRLIMVLVLIVVRVVNMYVNNRVGC